MSGEISYKYQLVVDDVKYCTLHSEHVKHCLKSQITMQVEAQNQVVRKLEEKERLLMQSLATVEKELQLRQQAMEMHKRKAIESAQSAADLKLHLEKYHR